MDGRRLAAVITRGGAEQNPAYRPTHPFSTVPHSQRLYTGIQDRRQDVAMAFESSAARIASQLRGEILHGDVAPGSKLAQVGLAERFGVSRIPVRDALANPGRRRAGTAAVQCHRGRHPHVGRRTAGARTTSGCRSSRGPPRSPYRMSAAPTSSTCESSWRSCQSPSMRERGWRPTPSSTRRSTDGPTARARSN